MKIHNPIKAVKSLFSRYIERLKSEENGAVMVIAAVSLVAFLSLTSLVVDVGLTYYQKSNLQNAMDAASLAGARYLPDQTRAKQVALEYVEKNGYDPSSVTVEFPTSSVIRVKDAFEGETIFATLFDIDSVHIDASAAAKFEEKRMNFDFDYLMFQGKQSDMNLGGGFQIDGNIFGNGNVNVNGGGGSGVSGVVGSAMTAYVNKWSCYYGAIESGCPHQDMPDWDEQIMDIMPTATSSMFNFPSISPHILPPPYKTYGTVYNSNYNINKIAEINTSMYVSGNLTTSDNNSTTTLLIILGDLYVAGNFQPTCALWVQGNVYVGQDFKATGYSSGDNFSITVQKNVYVEGDASFSCPLKVNGYFYAGGNLSLSGSTNVRQTFSDKVFVGGNINHSNTKATFNDPLYCRGSYTKNGNTTLTINDNAFIYGTVNWSNGGTYVYDDLYIYGNGVRSGSNVCYFSGPMTLMGDLYCGNGGGVSNVTLGFSGQGGYTIVGKIYCAGNVKTEQGGGGININGCMVAEGDVYFGGTPHMIEDDDNSTFSIYSRHGDVTFSPGAGYKVWGIVYAPEGNVAIRSSGEIYGSVVANTISSSPGSLKMGQNDRHLPFAKVMRIAILVE